MKRAPSIVQIFFQDTSCKPIMRECIATSTKSVDQYRASSSSTYTEKGKVDAFADIQMDGDDLDGDDLGDDDLDCDDLDCDDLTQGLDGYEDPTLEDLSNYNDSKIVFYDEDVETENVETEDDNIFLRLQIWNQEKLTGKLETWKRNASNAQFQDGVISGNDQFTRYIRGFAHKDKWWMKLREKLSDKPDIIKRIANTFIDVLRDNSNFENVKVKQHGTDMDLIKWVQMFLLK